MVSRIVGVSPTRGSLAIVGDRQHSGGVCKRWECLGAQLNLLEIVSWKDQSFSSCHIHDSFRFSVGFWNVALYPGWIGVYVSCSFAVIALFCRVVSSLCCCCHFPMMPQAADPALAVKRVIKDQSCESEGKHVVSCWNMLVWTV